MNLLDAVIILLLVAMFIRGIEIGFVRQLLAAAGVVIGILIGAWLTPHIVRANGSQLDKSVLTLLLTTGFGIVFLTIGEYLGIYIKQREKGKKINKVDGALGSILGLITLLASVWLAAAVFIKLPYPYLRSEIQQSAIIAALDKSLPSAPTVVTQLSQIIDPNGFPQVFVGTEPAPSKTVTLPTTANLQKIIAQASPSIVKIEGRGCGGIVLGSGFVAARGFVITNAHVVAGVSNPVVKDNSGAHPGTVVWFDPNLDMAVLRASNLDGPPLPITSANAERGVGGVVMGYPGGGSLTVVPAAVLEEFIATGRNIYNQGTTDRNVYELQTDVVPGNSGGPFIDSEGKVTGLVFAQSTAYSHIGYAIAMGQVLTEFHQAKQANQAVGTGACAQ